MLADEVAKMVYDLRRKIYLKSPTGDREPEIVVYMDNDTWLKMMSELHGPVSPTGFELYDSKGKTVYGCKIHRVITDGHGIKIYEA